VSKGAGHGGHWHYFRESMATPFHTPMFLHGYDKARFDFSFAVLQHLMNSVDGPNHNLYPLPQCDRRCQFPVMNNTGCGVHEVKCICNGKERALCQPPKPSNGNSCYKAQKELIQDSYMCGTDENTCEMCWQWTWKAPNCSERQKKSAEVSRRELSVSDSKD
jgi:hypothetical protein